MTAADQPRVMVYVQHLLGIGHLMRAAALVRAMRRSGMPVTLVSGGPTVSVLDLGGADFAQLPAAFAREQNFKRLYDAEGRAIDDAWRARRRVALFDVFARLRPDVLVIELYPFGRRQFRFELLPLLEEIRRMDPRPRVLCSVRDILVAKNRPEREAEMVETVERHFDAVLVHGDPDLVALDATFPPAHRIADKLRYTGYVVDPMPAVGPGEGDGEVVVSAGGGSVGGALLRTALAARPLSTLRDRRWRLLAGDNLPAADFDALRGAAGDGVVVERARRDFRELLGRCAVSVSQAGYNTVAELLAAGAAGVLVPYAGGGETEQALRARLLAERGWATVVEETALDAEALAAAVDRAQGKGEGSRQAIRFDGLQSTVDAVRDIHTARG